MSIDEGTILVILCEMLKKQSASHYYVERYVQFHFITLLLVAG